MTHDDKPAFVQAIRQLEAVPAWGTVSDATFEVYFKALHDIPIDAIRRAVVHILLTRTITGTFPVPAEIRAASLVLASAGEKTAAEAWIEVSKLRDGPPGKRPIFSADRVKTACEYIGGISDLRRADISAESTIRAQFVRAYEALTARDAMRALLGERAQIEWESKE